jgi:hypothetical protein
MFIFFAVFGGSPCATRDYGVADGDYGDYGVPTAFHLESNKGNNVKYPPNFFLSQFFFYLFQFTLRVLKLWVTGRENSVGGGRRFADSLAHVIAGRLL